MANFIGIHMLNELVEAREDGFGSFGGQGRESDNDTVGDTADLVGTETQFLDPQLGCHFQYEDLVKRIKRL